MSQPIQLQDRNVSASVSLLSLCPNMRLLAIVLDHNSVAIFRASWQRLATIPICTKPDETITALTWSATGAYISVTTSSNLLFIHSVDSSASAPSSRTRRGSRHTDPVAQLSLPNAASSIVWTHSPSFHTYYEDRASQLLNVKPETVAERGLLFVGDCDGMITILTSNLAFTIARIRVMPQNVPIRYLHVTSNVRCCFAVATSLPMPLEENGNTETVFSKCLMRAISTRPFLDYWSEIDRLSSEVIAFKAFITSCETNLKQLNSSWVGGLREILSSSIVKPLEKAMAQYAESGNAWDELQNLFCGARVKGASLHFLANSLGQNGAKELLRSFGVHDDDIEQTLAKILPLAENALSRASEYRGFARLESRFAPIGVQLEDAVTLSKVCEDLYFHLYEFCRKVDRVTEEMESFLSWLVLAAIKAGGEMQGRSVHIIGDLNGRALAEVAKFFDRMTLFNKNDKNISEFTNDPVAATFTVALQPELEAVHNTLSRMTTKLCDCISLKLRLSGGISFETKPPSPRSFIKCHLYDFDGSDDVVLAILRMHDGCVACIRHDVSTGLWNFAQRSPLGEGRVIKDGILISTHIMALITSPTTVNSDENASFDVNIEIHDLSASQLWSVGYAVTSTMEEISQVQLPAAIQMSKLSCKCSLSLKRNKSPDFYLSCNQRTGILGVLAAPRRVILFDLDENLPC